MTPTIIRRLRRLHHVPRWCVIPTIRQQSVAEHCFGVACAGMWLHVQKDFPEFDLAAALVLALRHDDYEAVSGDIPAPFKRKYVQTVMDELENCDWASSSVKKAVKCADLLDRISFLHEEMRMGNKLVIEIMERERKQFCLLASLPLLNQWLVEIEPEIHPAIEET